MTHYPLEALATEIDKQWREKDGMNCTEICAIIRSTPLPDYYTRAAAMLETIRDEIGHGYGTGDIEHITSITVARLKDWDKSNGALGWKFKIGQKVRKKSGSWWKGRIVGIYSTTQTPRGYNVQFDDVENGPVQIYPQNALELDE